MSSIAAARVRPTARWEQESKFGTQITAEGVRFRLWAPYKTAVSLKLFDPPRTLPMRSLSRGWFELEVEGAVAGTRYLYVMDDGTEVPDPATRFQPRDVHGPSEVIDPQSFEWTDRGWRGRPWEEMVFYEVHIGTFSRDGTFRAAIDKLDHLAELGVTAIELMPLADFPGRWNWGYDGALLFAPDSSYGRPDDLKALINAAHERGIMMFLDVVYNHFGPEGNYLKIYAPAYSSKHETPWGPAVNFDDEGSAMIREFVFANARYWLNEFRFDGLRFDAVHEIQDTGPKHMLQDLAEQIRGATDGRHIHLVAENSWNQANWLKRKEDGSAWLYNAQWSDDIHHSLQSAASGDSAWYYADYHGRTDLLARALAEGFAFQGERMEHQGATKGEPSAFLPPTAFVSFLQNHDQAGNRPFGERLPDLIGPQALRSLTVINLLSPHIPLLFMGEEWGSTNPFLYFSDLEGDLADKVRAARKEQLKQFLDKGDQGRQPLDPLSREAFLASKLPWEELQRPASKDHVAFVCALLRLRAAEITPRLALAPGDGSDYRVLGPGAFTVRWALGDDAMLALTANLSETPLDDQSIGKGQALWTEGRVTHDHLGPWSVLFRLEGKKAEAR